MKRTILKYAISFFFIAILLVKSAGLLVTFFSPLAKQFPVAELLLERETEEKKGSAKSETGSDELFNIAILPANDLIFLKINSTPIITITESLQEGYLTTPALPPNS